MVLKNYNCSLKFLLPLFDFDYCICNKEVEFIGAYTYCPYIAYPGNEEKLIVAYTLKTDNCDTNFPNIYKKDVFVVNNQPLLLITLNPPEKYKRDWNYILNSNFKEVSWECKNKILYSPLNKYNMEFILEALHDTPNRRLKQQSKNADTFGVNDILTW